MKMHTHTETQCVIGPKAGNDDSRLLKDTFVIDSKISHCPVGQSYPSVSTKLGQRRRENGALLKSLDVWPTSVLQRLL